MTWSYFVNGKLPLENLLHVDNTVHLSRHILLSLCDAHYKIAGNVLDNLYTTYGDEKCAMCLSAAETLFISIDWFAKCMAIRQLSTFCMKRWFSQPLGTLVSSTNKTDGHDITEILLKVAFIP
jgi:hypothetical protein